MENNVKLYKFKGKIDWKTINILSELDRFDASWSIIKRREGASLLQLKTMATIKSVGASTRIEGSQMTDKEVQVFLEKLNISSFEDRDSQEVAGYYSTLEIIIDNYDELSISEYNIKSLHSSLMKYSEKDRWHKGNYKQHSNAVEANFPDGSRQIIFQTTPPGYQTDDEMRSLVNWYKVEKEIHPLVKTSILAYEFLSIHPFQDGNGRLSRLLTTLSLIEQGYDWIQYVSFEHEIENSKKEYYKSLRHCQAMRPNEDITSWIIYFLNSLLNVKHKLSEKIERSSVNSKMSPREKSIYEFISNNPGCKSGLIAEKLGIPNPTVKRLLTDLVNRGILEKFGKGAGVNYTIK